MDSPVKPETDEQNDSEKREWVKNPNGLPEIYGNYLHTNWSLFDTRILIGHLKPYLGDSTKFVIEEQGAINLSWAQTKNLARLLGGMVRAYESVNGEIPQLKLAPNAEQIKAAEAENESKQRPV
jgi:hypothetical protein